MKKNKFLIVSLVLLTILTIGAVSASEDITDDTPVISVSDDSISEDGLTVSEEGADIDEAPVVGSPSANDGDDSIESIDDEIILGEGDDEDENPYYTFVNDDRIITDSDDEDYDDEAIVAGIILPPDTEDGVLNIFDDDDEVIARLDVEVAGEGPWHIDENGNLKAHLFLKDLDLTNVNDGDNVHFVFFDAEGTKVEDYSTSRKIEITDSYIRFYEEGGDEWDGDDGVIISVPNGEDDEFDLENQEDMNRAFVTVSVSNDLQGYIRVYYDNDDEDVHNSYFDKPLSEISNFEEDEGLDGFTRYYISLSDLDDFEGFLDWRYFRVGFSLASEDIDDREEIDSRGYNIEYYDDDSIVKFWEDYGGDEWDGDDGVIIYVPPGDQEHFFLDEDMDKSFAFVSIRDDMPGIIKIYLYDEDDEFIFFEGSLSDLSGEPDVENEGFTVYSICLNDIGENLDELLDWCYFEIGFFQDDDGNLERIDNRRYEIEYMYDDNFLRFWEVFDEDEGPHGEGEQIEAEFTSANILNNDVVVTIPKENVPEDVDNEFTVVILDYFEPKEITLKLDEILEGNNYILRVNDFDLPEFGESYGLFMFLQFYSDGEKTYYAEYWDDEEGIYIFASPYIFDETSLYLDDDVITIQEIPEGVDEFIITISKEGSEDIVKTFRFSEMDIDEEELWVAFKLNDLGITEEGDYLITVKFSDDLIYTGNLNVNSEIDIQTREEDDEGGLLTFTSVDEKVAKILISESVSGYVKIYVDGTQVGENINFADLPMGKWPTGRKVLLNHLKIDESGEHTVKLQVYSVSDELLSEKEFDILVEVSEFSVNIDERALPYGVEGILEFMVGKPVSDGQYFNIYFNDVKAGNFTVNDGLQMFDEFTIPMFDVKILKPGNFNVRVTFFDGETETDVATGSCSINELELFSDKEVYVYGIDPVIISFNMDSVEDDDVLRAYFVYGWDEVQRHDSMVFNPYGGQDMINDGLYKDGKVSFDIAHFGGEPDNDNYRLDLGETLIYAVYKFANGERLGGFIKVKVVEELEPIDPELSVEGPTEDIVFGSPVTITITAVDSFNGEVRVIMDGNVVTTTTLTNGQGTVTIDADKFAVGDNIITVENVADEDYMADSEEITVTVIKADSDVSVDSISFVYGESGTATATWTNATGVEAVIEGDLGNVLVEGNVITVSGLDAGNYNLFVTTIPGLNYLAKTITVPVTVSKADSGVSVDPISFVYGESGSAVATLTGATGVDASIEGYLVLRVILVLLVLMVM